VTATILDGRALRERMYLELAQRVAALTAAGHRPGLGTVLVGQDPGSVAYVRGKHADSATLGVRSIRRDLPADTGQRELLDVVAELNGDPECDGFIVQLPLPYPLEQGRVLEAVDPAKDVDGLHPVNLGRLVLNEPAPRPCTPVGVVRLLEFYGVPTDGAQVVIVGRGVTVGRPLGLLLNQRAVNATVTLCHTGTRDLAAEVRRADIVVAAAGVPTLITADMIKPGAAVVDVGISRTAAGLVGDVDPAGREVAGWWAPVPGGVGQMTRAMLLANTVDAAERRQAAGD